EMKTSHRKISEIFANLPRCFTICAAILTAFISSVHGRDATELEQTKKVVRRVEVDTVVDQMVKSLADGYSDTVLALRKANLGDVVDSIGKVDGRQSYDIESEELLREIYRRAEAHTAGQGDRVLAYLYKTAADKYPAVASDPAFQPLRNLSQSTNSSL